jgi:bifunctional non-homologous end joining protein LigD
MIEVSNKDRVVFADIGKTKGDVVAYYAAIAPRALPHLRARPLSIRRFPKGLSAPGFFQKNVPAHYPPSIARFAVPRSARDRRGRNKDITLYPLIDAEEQLAYLANQGAIELHVPTARAPDVLHPDRLVIDLDPPAGAIAEVRLAARLTRDALAEHGLASVPIATGSKGYHVAVALTPTIEVWELALAVQKFAALLVARHPDALTTTYRIALRGGRVFLDWLRNNPMSTVIAPYSLRATPRASVAAPLSWDELDRTPPSAFTIDDAVQLCERPDSLAELAAAPSDGTRFVAEVNAAFERSGLQLETFDRFRS